MARLSDCSALGPLVAALLLLASSSAFAQEDTTPNILGRHIGATAEAVSNFGAIGTTLTHISSSTFGGTGSQRRDMARLVESAFDPWRSASAATRDSLGLTVATRALTATDYATSVFAPGLEGDARGVVSGAVQVAVAPTIITAGTAVFGSLGTGAGALVGSIIPVVGTGLGGVVGGAIGKVAGGYLSAFAYDKWIKGWVGAGVEAGLAGLLDKGALQEAMQSRDQYFYDQSIPEMRVAWDEMRSKGIGFGDGQVELTGPDQTPYIVVPPEQAVVGDLLAGVTKFVVYPNPEMDFPLACTIDAGKVSCSGQRDFGLMQQSIWSDGVAVGNSLELSVHGKLQFKTEDGKCGYTGSHSGTEHVALEGSGRATFTGSYRQDLTWFGDCENLRTDSGTYDMVGTWRVVE